MTPLYRNLRPVLMALALLTTACGNRLSHSEILGAAGTSATSAANNTVGTDASGLGASQTSGAVAGDMASGGALGTPVRGGSGASAGPSARTAQSSASSGAAVPGVTGPRSPVVVASVSTLTGPVGNVIGPSVKGMQVWVRAVNARGGVNGHEVRAITFDDGGDPARHRAQVQQAVESDHIVAFLFNSEALSGASSVDYITQKRIPMVGIGGGEDWAYSSPMIFPMATSGPNIVYTAMASAAEQLIPLGKSKIGTLVCVEVATCDTADRLFAKSAPELGLQLVYRGKAGLTQPDFTAECLSARNAGAQILLIIMDSNSISRVGSSCARQGYHPNIATGSSLVLDSQKDVPYLTGMVAASPVFPWFQTGTPPTDEFQSDMRRFGKGLPVGVGPVTGWVAGKLFEKATANLPEPPTTAAILAGLWSIKSDTLGGITHPLTFVENQKPKPTRCWFDLAIKNGTWTSPDGAKLHCR